MEGDKKASRCVMLSVTPTQPRRTQSRVAKGASLTFIQLSIKICKVNLDIDLHSARDTGSEAARLMMFTVERPRSQRRESTQGNFMSDYQTGRTALCCIY